MTNKSWNWLTEKHFTDLEKFNDDLHFDVTTRAANWHEVLIPVVLPIDEALLLAMHRDGRNRKVIAHDISVYMGTLTNIVKGNYKPKIGVIKKILVYCCKFNCKVLLMKS